MIIADSDDEEAPYDPYYMEFSSTFSQWLDEVGFVTCPGYIIQWCKYYENTVFVLNSG